jgi:transposase-like protein
MKSKRKNHSSAFKAKVVIEALKEQKTIAELAMIYEIHPNQISIWKKEFLDNAPEVFDKSPKHAKDESDVAKLYEAIGQLQIENNWLKKKLL